MLTEYEQNYLQSITIEELSDCFITAIKEQHHEAIHFMLTSDLLKENVDIHMKCDYPFALLCNNCHQDEGKINLIKYLIFNYGIKLNKRIIKKIRYHEELQELFLTKKKMDDLEKSLEKKQETGKPKI